jgi:hypothetical protein
MAIVMNMSSYEIERSSVDANDTKNNLSTECNPAFYQTQLQSFAPSQRQRSMPWQLATVDLDQFLQKMRAS